MKSMLSLIGRSDPLFSFDLIRLEEHITQLISQSSFLVLGGAGTIGQATTKEIFKRNPKKLHVVDISENNLVELVRDLRSSYGYISGEFETFALDIGSSEYDAFFRNDGKYDYVLNLSALKHVRSEKDPYTIMRMINVNILNTEKTLKQAIEKGAKKYFCVSTDKAANPVNMMGASKRIMESFLMDASNEIIVSAARFANVAFSDGSLLYSFNQRISKRQPIVAPNDVKRYFITPQESGELCLMSCLFGENREIFFPKLTEEFNLNSFSDIATRYLKANGYKARLCKSEVEARDLCKNHPLENEWPCLFSGSDTTGEKEIEEFYMDGEELDLSRFNAIGIVKNNHHLKPGKLEIFKSAILEFKRTGVWSKVELVNLFEFMIEDFRHHELGRFLEGKM